MSSVVHLNVSVASFRIRPPSSQLREGSTMMRRSNSFQSSWSLLTTTGGPKARSLSLPGSLVNQWIQLESLDAASVGVVEAGVVSGASPKRGGAPGSRLTSSTHLASAACWNSSARWVSSVVLLSCQTARVSWLFTCSMALRNRKQSLPT